VPFIALARRENAVSDGVEGAESPVASR
jgi:hypothetical protein